VNVSGPAVALVFSPETWVEELHRHLSHHGGARVRQIVVEPSIALDEDYDVLVVSDRWPALTFGFVGAVHGRGRRILGVFDPEEPAGKDHLVGLGVDATIAADAAVGEFVLALHELDAMAAAETGASRSAPARGRGELDDGCGRVVAVSGPRGSGVTEVALGLAAALAGARRSVLLVDAHETAPSLAGRLGLGLEPNLRTAVDACAHGIGTLDECVVPIAGDGGGLCAVAGHPSAIAAAQVTTHDVLDVIAVARRHHEFVVVDLEDRSATGQAVTAVADVVVGVAHASPVGVIRALDWLVDAMGARPALPLHLVVNHAPRSAFRQEEIRAEITRTVQPASLVWCPHDRAVELAAWNGTTAGRGGFRSACAQVSATLAPHAGTRRSRWSR
jgi:MinD-like ATPase involved in chromosome partitioning or flagellar assembly